MATETNSYEVFHGLQKPLEFMGIRGRFLTLAAAAAGLSFLGFIAGAIAGGQLCGFLTLLVMLAVSAISIFIRQKQGLHNKRRDRVVVIYTGLYNRMKP